MIINMTGGGGGAALNFKVVPGLTQPGTASENTIWVKTEQIGAWYFSPTQPEGMKEWDVWFPTYTFSSVEFNALKKNGIQVYPTSAKQYVSGAWVNIPAMIYQSGEWLGVSTFFYNKDGMYIGEWCCYPYKSNTIPSTIATATPTISFDQNGMKIIMPGKAKVGLVVNDELYNFDGVKNIKVTYTVAAMSDAIGNFQVNVIDKIANGFTSIALAAAAGTVGNSVTIDLPCNLGSKQGYVGLSLWSGDNGNFSFTLEKVELER